MTSFADLTLPVAWGERALALWGEEDDRLRALTREALERGIPGKADE